MQPVLLFGAESWLGQQLASLLATNFTVIPLNSDTAQAPATLYGALSQAQAKTIINCAGGLDSATAEANPEQSREQNFAIPVYLAGYAAANDIPLIHFSSPHVFSPGADQPLSELDPAAPLGQLGATHCLGEDAIREQCPWHLILRCGWLYIEPFALPAEATQNTGTCQPISIAHLSEWLIPPLSRLAKGENFGWGTYHLAGHTTRWSDLAAAWQSAPSLSPAPDTGVAFPLLKTIRNA